MSTDRSGSVGGVAAVRLPRERASVDADSGRAERGTTGPSSRRRGRDHGESVPGVLRPSCGGTDGDGTGGAAVIGGWAHAASTRVLPCDCERFRGTGSTDGVRVGISVEKRVKPVRGNAMSDDEDRPTAITLTTRDVAALDALRDALLAFRATWPTPRPRALSRRAPCWPRRARPGPGDLESRLG